MLIFLAFTAYSYTVAKEFWQQIDFDITVKLQDRISRKWDGLFSYFSFMGSAEVIVAVSLILALLSLIRLRWMAFLGWLFIIPATFFEIFGKLFLYHPGPPKFLHRSLITTNLPSFYVHTDYSYPSGHMTRTIFLLTVFLIIVLLSNRLKKAKYPIIALILFFGFLMFLTRVYLGEHWLSDVVGGSLLGLAAGLFAGALITSRQTLHN